MRTNAEWEDYFQGIEIATLCDVVKALANVHEIFMMDIPHLQETYDIAKDVLEKRVEKGDSIEQKVGYR